MTELSPRERVLRLFRHEKIDRAPVFSGMGNITEYGLQQRGLIFSQIHTDPSKMAAAAASTFELFGFECAVAPFDMCVEAEALGAKVNFYAHRTDVVYPTMSSKLAPTVKELNIALPPDMAQAGRIPVVRDALSRLRPGVGKEVAIGAYVLGPYTLAGQITDLSDLTKATMKDPASVNRVLGGLAAALVLICSEYRKAGADYITVREMGAGSDILSPRLFKSIVAPHLKRIFREIESPKVLHICGSTDAIIDMMADCGADAIAVEKKNNLAETRRKLGPEAIILGNIDAFDVMVRGKPEDIERAVQDAIGAGASGIWPGCDIWPTVPPENMNALVAAVKRHGKLT